MGKEVDASDCKVLYRRFSQSSVHFAFQFLMCLFMKMNYLGTKMLDEHRQ